MPDNEEGVPQGDYLNSCNGCKLQGDADELFCSHCMKSCGARVMAVMYDVKQCKVDTGSNIYNFDGNLVCEDPLPENDGGIPQGTYQFSCYGCSIVEMNLTCTACLDEARGRHHSTIPIAGCTSFGNSAGKLQCDELERRLDWMKSENGGSRDQNPEDEGYVDPFGNRGGLDDNTASADFEGDPSVDQQHYLPPDHEVPMDDHGMPLEHEMPPGDEVPIDHEVPEDHEAQDDAESLEASGEGAPGEDVEISYKPKKRKKKDPPSPWEYDTPDGRRAARKLPGAEALTEDGAAEDQHTADIPPGDPSHDPGPAPHPVRLDQEASSLSDSDDLAPDPYAEHGSESDFQDDLGPESLPAQGSDYNSDILPDDLGDGEAPATGMDDYNSDIVPDDLGSEEAPPHSMEDYNSDIVPDDLGPPADMEDYNSDIVPDDLEGADTGAGADDSDSMHRDHSEL